MYVLMLKRVQADGSSSGIEQPGWRFGKNICTHLVWEDSNFFVSMPLSTAIVLLELLTRRYGPNQLRCFL